MCIFISNNIPHQLISYGKAKQVLDMQVADKQKLREISIAEEKRLDSMMKYDNDLCNDLQIKLDDLKLEEKKRVIGNGLKEQIEEREQARTLERERVQREAKEALDKLQSIAAKDKAAYQLKHEGQRKVREAILRDIADSRMRKQNEEAMERAFENNIIEYQLQRDNEKAEREADETNIKKKKELESLLVQMAIAKETKRAEDDDNARMQRSMYLAEKQWREQELAKAVLKRRDMEELNRTRAWQSEDRLRTIARQEQLEREDLERTQRAMRQHNSNVEEEEIRRSNRVLAYGQQLRQQIVEREMEAIAQRREQFEANSSAKKEENFETLQRQGEITKIDRFKLTHHDSRLHNSKAHQS